MREGRRDRLPAVVFMVLLLSSFPPLRSYADSVVSARIDAYQSIGSNEIDEWRLSTLGRGRLDVRSRGNNFVRGRLTLEGLLLAGDAIEPVTLIDIERAFVKVRFPLTDESFFNVTAGKTRLTWGDGAFYNAGDIIFGSAANPDFTQETLRDETIWLAAAFFPLAEFAFVETVVIPPALVTPGGLGETQTIQSTPQSADSTAFGARLQFKPLNIKSEVGYLYRSPIHNPYISLQWNLLVDMYLSSTVEVSHDRSADPIIDSLWEEWLVSYGLLHVVDLPSDATLSLRVEALLRPMGDWRQDHSDPEADPTYGIALFGEALWAISATFAVSLRSVISPVDLSALIVPSLAWSPYQGITVLLFPSIQIGEREDRFGISKPNGILVTAGLSFAF